MLLANHVLILNKGQQFDRKLFHFRREFALFSSDKRIEGQDEYLSEIQMEPLRHGRLEIKTTPSADVHLMVHGQPCQLKTPVEIERFPAGKYTIKLVNDVIGAEKTVTGNVEEFRSLKPNRALLESIAKQTGGEVIAANKLEDFAAGLPKLLGVRAQEPHGALGVLELCWPGDGGRQPVVDARDHEATGVELLLQRREERAVVVRQPGTEAVHLPVADDAAAVDVQRNRRRTVLTILSVGISLFLLGILIALYFAFYHREGPPEQALRLATRHRVSLTFPLPEFYSDRIRQIPGVTKVCRASWYGGVYLDRRPEHNFARFGVDHDRIFDIRPELKLPPDQRAAFERERTAAAVGRTLVNTLGFQLGQRLLLQQLPVADLQ